MIIPRSFLCCLMLCAACGEDDPEPRTREEFCRDWAAAACSEEVVDVCQAKSAEDCRQSQESFCRDLVPDAFSDREGASCIDAVKAAYVDGELEADELATVLALGEPCDRLTVGSKSEGESCSERAECDVSSGFECVLKSGSDEGTCEVPEEKEGGRDCEAAQATCEVGFFCDGSNCIEARDAGDDCTIQAECGESGYCNDDGQCAERVAISDPCSADVQCSSGLCYEFEGEKTCTDHIVLARAEPLCDELK
jgi:hypothetical protein